MDSSTQISRKNCDLNKKNNEELNMAIIINRTCKKTQVGSKNSKIKRQKLVSIALTIAILKKQKKNAISEDEYRSDTPAVLAD